LERCGRAAAAAARPGSAARGDGQGLRGLRAGAADQPGGAACPGYGHELTGRAHRGGEVRGFRGHETGRAGGVVPGSQGQREFPRPAFEARRNRKPDPVRAPLLQRRRESLQQPHPEIPGHGDRQHLRLQAGGVLRCGREGDRGSPGDAVMKKLFLPLLILFAAAQVAHADERILAFDSTITVNPDGTLEVREVLRVSVEGRDIRRGIVREFPTTYPREGGGQVVVGFEFRSATRDGADEPWRAEPSANGVRVYLGSASVMLPHGEHTYELVYRTDRQMGFFADHDELYWNVTGNGSNFPIDQASARLLLPDAIPRGDIRLEAYTGMQGEGPGVQRDSRQWRPVIHDHPGIGPP